jgi:hypothetical protein
LNKFCYKIDTKISNFILTFSKTNFFDQNFVSKLEHRLNFKVGASALLGPQRFENLGVPDEDFLKRRSYDEVKALCEATGDVDMCRFDETFYQAASLFPDGQKMVSFDAILYINQNQIKADVAIEHDTTNNIGGLNDY